MTVSVAPRRSPADADVAGWLSRPVAERLSAVETLREQCRLFAGQAEMPRLEKIARVLPPRP